MLQGELPTINKACYASNAVMMDDRAWNEPVGVLRGGADLRQQAMMQAAFQKTQPKAITMRIVKVFIADPNPNIPLEKRIIYSGEEKLTDLTDQELFFEINLGELLKKHNEMRVQVLNKAVKDRNEFLEPARVRDLSMVVVDVATF